MREFFKNQSTISTIVVVAVVCATGLVRLIDIQQRPMHSDEAVQAVKTGILLETGHYEYDPFECHGPSLYYLTLPFLGASGKSTLAETSEWNFRIVPVFFSLALILLLLFLQNSFSPITLIFAAVLTALSPAMSFYSRFYVQEMILVFFTYAAIVAGWRFLTSRATGWAVVTGVSLGFMFVTKETCIIAYTSMFIALVSLAIVALKSNPDVLSRSAPAGMGLRHSSRCLLKRVSTFLVSFPRRTEIKESRTLAQLLLAALAGFVVLFLFYSSFLANFAGIVDSVLAYKTYIEKGCCAGDHIHPWYYYFKMLIFSKYRPGPFWSEALILALAIPGYVAMFRGSGRNNDRALVRFFGIATILMAIIYSLIPYKTPWCLLSFLMGFIIMAGVGLDYLLNSLKRVDLKALCLVIIALAVCQLGQQNYRTNFVYYSDNRNPYVYAHPTNDVKRLAGRIESLARVSDDKNEMLIKVISQDYWPLPWYLRKFRQVGYWSEPMDTPDASVVITSLDYKEAVIEKMTCPYRSEFYGLRPDVMLVMYIQTPLWDEFLKTR